MQKDLTRTGSPPVGELHFRWDQDLIYTDILPNWYRSHVDPWYYRCLSFGEIFNTVLKGSTIKKGLLKRFAIHGSPVHFDQILPPRRGVLSRWEDPVLNLMEEVILVHEGIMSRSEPVILDFTTSPVNIFDLLTRLVEDEFNLIRMRRI